MIQPQWLRVDAIVAIQKILVAEHGGIAEIRDQGLLESALARPQNKFSYEADSTLFSLASAYAFGIARNHPFVDGNKRVAFTAIAMFLRINGQKYAPEKMDALQTIMKLAAGEIAEDDLARWIEANCTEAR